MVDEPTLNELPDDLDRPLNRADFAELRSDLAVIQRSLAAVQADLAGKATTAALASVRSELRRDLAAVKRETLDHFDVAVENITAQLTGANADELSLLGDKTQAHEIRLQAIERKTGLR
jgi:hypothetical protein